MVVPPIRLVTLRISTMGVELDIGSLLNLALIYIPWKQLTKFVGRFQVKMVIKSHRRSHI
jgi:hypothetical protein